MRKDLKIALILCVALLGGVHTYGGSSNSASLNMWIANAVQWDSVWGRDELTCANGKSTLSDELKSSKSHTFGIEVARSGDGVIALLPTLHRLVSVRVTREQELGSITINSTCASDLRSYFSQLKSLRKGRPVHDPRLQKLLEKMNRLSQRPNPDQVKIEMGMIEIGAPTLRSSPRLVDWPTAKIDSLKSVEAAAQASFEHECTKGETAVAEVPDFKLYDPALLVVITAKDGSCVLPMGFEYRQSSSDAYVAYAEYHCFEDSELLRKTQRLIRVHRATTKLLTCSPRK